MNPIYFHYLRRTLVAFDQFDGFSGKQFPHDLEDSPVGHITLGFFADRHEISIVTFLDDLFRARIDSDSHFDEHGIYLQEGARVGWLMKNSSVEYGETTSFLKIEMTASYISFCTEMGR
jgi:hypothetical protein